MAESNLQPRARPTDDEKVWTITVEFLADGTDAPHRTPEVCETPRPPSYPQRPVPTYRIHDTTGDDLGLMEHSARNVEPRDLVMLADGREPLVTARVDEQGRIVRSVARSS